MARRASAPRADLVLKKTVKQLGEGAWPTGLTVLTGDDLYHLDRAQRALLENLVPADAEQFGLTILGDEKIDAGSVVAAARSAGMFAERRVVLMRDVGNLDGEPDSLIAYAKNPPAASYLIVRAPALDQRRKLHKALVAHGQVLQFASPEGDPKQILQALNSMAKERKLTLDPEAAIYLAEAVGGNLQRAEQELDKLRCYVGDSGRVDRQAAGEVCMGSEFLSGWELADAILQRDRHAALAAVGQLLDSGDEPIRIVGGLAWRARTMLQAKAMLERGAPGRQVVQATRAWHYQRELLDGLRRYSLDELIAFPSTILEADRTLKSRSLSPRAVLERLVEGLT